ncbi:HAD family hydrolase [Maricaulis sp. CAU 1757]
MSRLIALDVDSTLLRVESLDGAIAAALGNRPDAAQVRTQLEAITSAGMSGRMALRDSLEQRLRLAALDTDLVAAQAERLRHQVTPGMRPLLAKLRARGDRLMAISGGFHDLIDPALAELGFDRGDVHANDFTWADGRVTGLLTDNPLSRNGGKAEIMDAVATGSDESILVGDGMTDFEAFENGAVDRFIGFGAIAKREILVAACEYAGCEYVRSTAALAKALGV